jgi:fumarate hydratase subunit alpha
VEKEMRIVPTKKIEKLTERLAIEANTILRADILAKLKEAYKRETKSLAKMALGQLIENAKIAKKEKLAICQDTGLPIVFIELGKEVFLKGDTLEVCINRGIESAYRKANFRKSIIQDPLRQKKDIRLTPVVIYVDIKPGKKIKLIVLPKGFGSENVSRIKMFKPMAEEKEIVNFVVETAKTAGPAACPPFIIGIGMGGTLDKAVIISKKAVLHRLSKTNPSPILAKLERKILKEVNRIKLGPMGFGGNYTALGVKILTSPTHIAGLPVAVSIGCHATRSATAII